MNKLKQKKAKNLKSQKLNIQRSLKVKNSPTHHHREHKAVGTTWASFRTRFKATINKLGQQKNLHIVSKTLCALLYIIKY